MNSTHEPAMDRNETIKFIDEESPQHFGYVWKKKKAVQKVKCKRKEDKDFRQMCLENYNDDSFDESYSESKTYFGREGNSSGDDAPDITEEEEFSNHEISLSPRAPLVSEEKDEGVFSQEPDENLEIVVSEGDHERLALITGLTVKDEDEVTQRETEAEALIKYVETSDNVPRKRVHFKEEPTGKRKCIKNEDVTPLTDEGLEIDLLFTDDVTIRVSFKEGKPVVEGGDGASGIDELSTDSISGISEETNDNGTKAELTGGDQENHGVSELVEGKGEHSTHCRYDDTSFSSNTSNKKPTSEEIAEDLEPEYQEYKELEPESQERGLVKECESDDKKLETELPGMGLVKGCESVYEELETESQGMGLVNERESEDKKLELESKQRGLAKESGIEDKELELESQRRGFVKKCESEDKELEPESQERGLVKECGSEYKELELESQERGLDKECESGNTKLDPESQERGLVKECESGDTKLDPESQERGLVKECESGETKLELESERKGMVKECVSGDKELEPVSQGRGLVKECESGDKEGEPLEVQCALEGTCVRKGDCNDRCPSSETETDPQTTIGPEENPPNIAHNKIIGEIDESKLDHELWDSEKSLTSENVDNLSIPVEDLEDVSSSSSSSSNCSETSNNDNLNDNDEDEHSYSFAHDYYEEKQCKEITNMFTLHDIIEEESCSDLDQEDYASSESTVFFETVESQEPNDDKTEHSFIVSNDSNLANYAKNTASEESTNSDSSLEKCEIESLEKDTHRAHFNPILNLLEMQEKEEIYESSLEILQAFRSNLIPGITSASNWISCCDSDELSLGVVEEEGRGECGRRALSTGARREGGGGAAALSSDPPALPTGGDHASDPEDTTDSLQEPCDSLDTVIRVERVDREVQVDSGCQRCEQVDETTDRDVRPSDINIDDSSEVCDKCDSVRPVDDLLSEKEILRDEVSEKDFDSGKEDKEKVDVSEKEDSPKDILKELFPLKRKTNPLENLPLIFPRARGLSETKPVNKNKFESLFSNSPFAKTNKSDESDNNKFEKSEEKEIENASSVLSKEETNNLKNSVPPLNGSLFGPADLKIDNLFQFNVRSHEGVTSFSEDAKDTSSEDEMKQKKKNEDNRSHEEAVGSSAELCNGYHRPSTLKSALKRNSTKKSKKKHRVQFDESLNKFFDADYVILIREEPEDFDGDYDVGGCDCGEDFCYDDCCDEDEDEEEFREPQSPRFDMCAAFEPPVEFVDQVTLSPPDGYKDTSHYCPHHHSHAHPPPHPHPRLPLPPLATSNRRPDGKEEWQQTDIDGVDGGGGGGGGGTPTDTRTEATNTDDDLNQGSPESDQTDQVSAAELSQGQQQQKQLMHQLAQQHQRYVVETITMTTVTERRIVREAERKSGEGEEQRGRSGGGILKGGKLWRSGSTDSGNQTDPDEEDEERRGVRFGGKESSVDPEKNEEDESPGYKTTPAVHNPKPNSAVRQLFPAQRFNSSPSGATRSPEAESLEEKDNLKMFEEAKRNKLQQYYASKNASRDGSSQTASSPQQEHPPSDDDEGLSSSLIKRTIERNTLRRSLLKYPHDIRLKRNQNKLKNENSLVERIKQLTCDVDDEPDKGKEGENTRISPSGEESQKVHSSSQHRPDKIASSGMSSTYKKITDLFSRRDKLEAAHPSVILQTPMTVERQYTYYQPVYHQQTTPPDLGNGLNQKQMLQQRNSVTTEARKQFLSSLAPLTACVSGNLDDSPVNRDNLPLPGDRNSIASTSTAKDSEYSLDDIEEVLNSDENKSHPQPDVVAGTPAGNSEQDELALFVQQDAGRIERIRKRYSSTPNSAGSDDDEHDDYGFNRRPSVRGIKPRFGSTTEILQQMQSQLQPPPLACPSRVGSHITWPYYAPVEDRRANPNRAPLPLLKEETHFAYLPDHGMEYAANSPVDPARTYQHQMIYSSAGNLHQPMRIGGGGDVQYPPRVHHVHSESPPRVPPMGMMVPFQEHEFSYRTTAPIYARRAIPGSVVQMRVSPIPTGSAVRLPLHPPYVEPEPHYSTQPLPPGTTSIIRVGQQQTIRVPYPTGGPVQVHLLATRRSESPQRGSPSQQQGFPAGQYVVARGTQTASISSTYYNISGTPPPRPAYYPSPPVPQNNPNYNRGPLIYSEHPPKPPHLYTNNNYPPNPHRATSPIQSLTSSPTRIKPQNERGVPEGAASSSPAFLQDSYPSQTNAPSPSSEQSPLPTTCDSATSPTTPPQAAPPSSVYYSMNV